MSFVFGGKVMDEEVFIGRSAAVADEGGAKIRGFSVHLIVV